MVAVSELRPFRPWRHRLSNGPSKCLPTYLYRGRAPVVADRNPFVIRKQRIIRPEKASHIRRMMDRGVEIGVVADLRWYAILRRGLRDQTSAKLVRLRGIAAERSGKRQPQGRPRVRAECHERVQRWRRARRRCTR